MKKLKEIKQMIESAQSDWAVIAVSENMIPLSSTFIAEKQEELKVLLEDIRTNIESFLLYSRNSLLAKVCIDFLKRIGLVSDKLGASYVFPGYNGSYDIDSTLKFAEEILKKS